MLDEFDLHLRNGQSLERLSSCTWKPIQLLPAIPGLQHHWLIRPSCQSLRPVPQTLCRSDASANDAAVLELLETAEWVYDKSGYAPAPPLVLREPVLTQCLQRTHS